MTRLFGFRSCLLFRKMLSGFRSLCTTPARHPLLEPSSSVQSTEIVETQSKGQTFGVHELSGLKKCDHAGSSLVLGQPLQSQHMILQGATMAHVQKDKTALLGLAAVPKLVDVMVVSKHVQDLDLLHNKQDGPCLDSVSSGQRELF